MIKINLIEDTNRSGEKVKARELTSEEQASVIASVSTQSKVIFFQQEDVNIYIQYNNDVQLIQEEYQNKLTNIINNL